jgi:hypothetical protein
LRKLLTTLAFTIGVAASACGNDGGQSTPPDAALSDAEVAACTFTGFSAGTQIAERDTELGVLFYTARSGVAPDIELLTFDLYFPLGATDGVHDYTFTGETLADCHTCLQMRRNCGGNSCISGQKFLAQEGTVSITQVGPAGTAMQGSFSNLKLAEITIGPNLSTTVVPGGDSWCIESYSFDQNITAP